MTDDYAIENIGGCLGLIGKAFALGRRRRRLARLEVLSSP